MKSWLVGMLGVVCLSGAAYADGVGGDIINNDGDVIGHVSVRQGTEGVLIHVKASDLPPGWHGMHFHQVGSCDDHDHFKLAEGHVAPSGKPHGYLNTNGPHEGNLPNLIVAKDGTVEVELYSELVSLGGTDAPNLLDADGSTLIIHADPDDHDTQPIGGAGARIACAVVATEE